MNADPQKYKRHLVSIHFVGAIGETRLSFLFNWMQRLFQINQGTGILFIYLSDECILKPTVLFILSWRQKRHESVGVYVRYILPHYVKDKNYDKSSK